MIPSQPKTVDPYRVLGLGHDASDTQIKRSYRELAMRLHPDRLQRVGASDASVESATAQFAQVTTAYRLLSDPHRKRQYDHIYKYGGFDEANQDSATFSSAAHQKGTPQMGIGYAVSDPITYVLSLGKERKKAVAGISIPKRFNVNQCGTGNFSVSISSGEVKHLSTGSVHMRSKTTQFVQGKKQSKMETTTLHSDGRKVSIIEGDDYVERKISTTSPNRRRRQRTDDDITQTMPDQPWYMNAWKDIRSKIGEATVNPCGAISVR